jgi:DNA polymerase II small subunit
VSEELKKAIGSILEAGYQLSVDGFEYLKTLEAPLLQETVKKVLYQASRAEAEINFIDGELLRKVEVEDTSRADFMAPILGGIMKRPLAKDHASEIKVLNDIPPESSGDLEGFLEYFRSRFENISKIMRNRMDMKDVVTIGRTLSMPEKTKVKVIGFVSNKRSSGSRLFVELEDEEDSITVMASDRETVRKGLSLLMDQVICVEGVKFRQDLMIAKDFIWPDIPARQIKRSEVPLCAAFLADVHIGSLHFRRDLFERFINWLNMKVGPPQSRKLASRVKYVIVSGDLVDGIGVYPNQMDELEVSDIREQYEVSAQLLSGIPDYVEIILLPGNHDAVRKSLPQPTITRDYAESLHDDDRIHFHPNPSRINLHGVEAFLSHGKALDEILAQVPGLDFHHPVNGMELLLRCRHVAPTYGNSTPIAPERSDRLIIESAPDLFNMGHIHVHGVKKYKGTTIIASGGWQAQTPFQKRVNLDPTVGVAPIVDLQTHQVIALDFNKLG